MTKKRELFAVLTGGVEKPEKKPMPKDEPKMSVEDEEFDEADLTEEEPDEGMVAQARDLIDALGIDAADATAVAKSLARFIKSC